MDGGGAIMPIIRHKSWPGENFIDNIEGIQDFGDIIFAWRCQQSLISKLGMGDHGGLDPVADTNDVTTLYSVVPGSNHMIFHPGIWSGFFKPKYDETSKALDFTPTKSFMVKVGGTDIKEAHRYSSYFVSLRMKFPATIPGDMFLISDVRHDNLPPGFSLYWDNTNSEFIHEVFGVSTIVSTTSHAWSPDTLFHDITITGNGVTNYLFFDGTLVSTDTITGSVMSTNASTGLYMAIKDAQGNGPSGPNLFPFKGKIQGLVYGTKFLDSGALSFWRTWMANV